MNLERMYQAVAKLPEPYHDDGKGRLIYCGDCRELLPLIEPGSIDLLWTDPPYGHSNQDGDLQSARVRDGVKGARVRECVAIANDTAQEMREAVSAMLDAAAPLLKSDCCCCCCCAGGGGPKVTFAWLANQLDRDAYQFFHAVVWDKSGRGHGLGWRFRRDYEFVMVAHRRGGKLAWHRETAEPNILFVQPTGNEYHPTEKPQELVGWFIESAVSDGGIILDPFMGSGTTLRAAKDLGRCCIGIEIEDRYCEIAKRRLAQEVLF